MRYATTPAKRWGTRIGHFLILAAFVAFTAFPFYWMLITTFKSTLDLVNTKNNPFLFNAPPTLENLQVLFFQNAIPAMGLEYLAGRGDRGGYYAVAGGARGL
ncbi:hypothetical protein [Eoetvoesiella caeni]